MDGVRDATEFGPIALQEGMDALDALLPSPPQPQSEDCLYLNLWTPGLDDSSRPVMFWIHGGAFTLGSGSEPLYSGANLARRGDVVVVTINYRLGAFGFLHEPALGPSPHEANFGMRDMIAALRWVRDNITNFGGDPDKVTIFGESAGGAAVACLLVSPEAQGLFHRAIGMSTAGDHGILFDGTQPTTDQLYAQLGLDKPSAEQLRSLPASDLLARPGGRRGGRIRGVGGNVVSATCRSVRLVDGIILDRATPLDRLRSERRQRHSASSPATPTKR